MAASKYTRGKNGLFHTLMYGMEHTTATGKNTGRIIWSDKSSKDLENKVTAFTEKVKMRQTIVKSDYTFMEYAQRWLIIFKADRAVKTRELYERIIDRYLSAIGNVPLAGIDLVHIQTVLNNAADKKRTQQQILLTFKQIIKSAVQEHLYPLNTATDMLYSIKPIKYKSAEKRALTDEEAEAVFEADLSDSDRAFLYLLYGCGIRREEALALTAEDFDLEKHTVKIDKAMTFDKKNQPILKEPKSVHGYRTIPIPGNTFPAIEKYLQELTPFTPYLFHNRSDKQMTKDGFRRMWERIMNALQKVTGTELLGLSPHVFRHNYCSHLCYQIPTISIKMIAKLMGDTDQMVINVYNHIILEKEDAEAAIENAIGNIG
jgi:integrase